MPSRSLMVAVPLNLAQLNEENRVYIQVLQAVDIPGAKKDEYLRVCNKHQARARQIEGSSTEP